MTKPVLYIIAGAPGSGKSRSFPVSEFGVDFFNADDRAAERNGGSYHDISLEIRAGINKQFESFIDAHIAQGQSFAFETTLRSPIIFEQMAAASANGFDIVMRYIGISDLAQKDPFRSCNTRCPAGQAGQFKHLAHSPTESAR